MLEFKPWYDFVERACWLAFIRSGTRLPNWLVCVAAVTESQYLTGGTLS
jgi:hypothetical protein